MLKWKMISLMFDNEKGQGMVEYGLILALIAVVVIAAMTTMGTNLQTLFTNISTQL